jgi:hypothetical protein
MPTAQLDIPGEVRRLRDRLDQAEVRLRFVESHLSLDPRDAFRESHATLLREQRLGRVRK